MKCLPLLLLLLSFNLFAADAGLTWVETDQREDGTVFTEDQTKEYRVYYGTVTGDYQNSVSVIRPDANAVTPLNLTLNLPTGFTYYFVVTTVDLEGRESVYSTEVSIPLDHENPKAPTGVIVIKIVTNTTVTVSPTN